jgi:hypothetical protein
MSVINAFIFIYLSLTKAFKPEPAYKGGFKVSFGSLSHISDSFMCFASPKSTHKTAPFRSQNFVINGFFGEQGKNAVNTVCIHEYFNDASAENPYHKI